VWKEGDVFVAAIFGGWYTGRGRTAKEAQANATRAFELEQALLGNYDLGSDGLDMAGTPTRPPSQAVQLTLWSMDDGR